MISEALRPMLEQLEHQDGTLRQLQHAVTNFSRRFEDALQEEARQADSRMHHQEKLLRQHVEAVAHGARAPDSTKAVTQDDMAEAMSQALGPLETCMARLEAGMSSHQRQLEVTNRFQEMQHERDVKRFQAAKQKSGVEGGLARQLTRQLSSAPSSGKHFGESPSKRRFPNIGTRGSTDNLGEGDPATPQVVEADDKDSMVRSEWQKAKEDQQTGKDVQLVQQQALVQQQTHHPGDETPPASMTPQHPTGPSTPAPQHNVARSESSQSLHRGSTHSFTTETSALFLPDALEREHLRGERTSDVVLQQVAAEEAPPPRATSGGRRSSILGMPFEEARVLCAHAGIGLILQHRILDFLLGGMGWWQELKEPQRRGEVARLINSSLFKGLCSLVIFCNALFIVYTTNDNMSRSFSLEPEDNEIGVEVINICFLSFYTLELALKMGVHKGYFFVGPELMWNVFDLALVVLSIYSQFFAFLLSNRSDQSANASALRALRVVRLARVLRVLQLMRVFNDLRMLLHAVLGSAITLFWSLTILGCVYYFFAVAFVQLLTAFLNEHPAATSLSVKNGISSHFGNVGTAIMTLFKLTFGGYPWGDLYDDVLVQTDWMSCVFFLFFIAFMKISMMNILTAVFVEQTIRLAQPDLQVRAKIAYQKEKSESRELKKVFSQLDHENTGTISAVEFQYLLESTHIRHYLYALGLDVRNAEEVFSVLALTAHGESVDIDAFVEGCMSMRGVASSVGQQNLVMETKMMRRSQREHCLILMEKLDAVAQRVAKRNSEPVHAPLKRSREIIDMGSSTQL